MCTSSNLGNLIDRPHHHCASKSGYFIGRECCEAHKSCTEPYRQMTMTLLISHKIAMLNTSAVTIEILNNHLSTRPDSQMLLTGVSETLESMKGSKCKQN
jgi:hypothetical protein